MKFCYVEELLVAKSFSHIKHTNEVVVKSILFYYELNIPYKSYNKKNRYAKYTIYNQTNPFQMNSQRTHHALAHITLLCAIPLNQGS